MNPVLLWFHQLGSPPTFDRFAARWAPVAFALALLTMAAGLYGALFAVPLAAFVNVVAVTLSSGSWRTGDDPHGDLIWSTVPRERRRRIQ